MKRRLCSNDMLAVGDSCYLLKEDFGEILFCSLRCLAIWSVQRATRRDPSIAERGGVFTLTTAGGEEQEFTGLVEVARWASAKALDG